MTYVKRRSMISWLCLIAALSCFCQVECRTYCRKLKRCLWLVVSSIQHKHNTAAIRHCRPDTLRLLTYVIYVYPTNTKFQQSGCWSASRLTLEESSWFCRWNLMKTNDDRGTGNISWLQSFRIFVDVSFIVRREHAFHWNFHRNVFMILQCAIIKIPENHPLEFSLRHDLAAEILRRNQVHN